MLVSNYDILEELACAKEKFEVMPFIEYFKAFNFVKKACFGLKLDPDFEAIIDRFQKALEEKLF